MLFIDTYGHIESARIDSSIYIGVTLMNRQLSDGLPSGVNSNAKDNSFGQFLHCVLDTDRVPRGCRNPCNGGNAKRPSKLPAVEIAKSRLVIITTSRHTYSMYLVIASALLDERWQCLIIKCALHEFLVLCL